MARPVEVVDYDPAWPAQFAQLRSVLAEALGDLALAIEHVGSTSVPGLAAKPILDIDVVIATRDLLPAVIERLAKLGYRHEGDRGVDEREAFDWGEHEFDEVPLDGSGRRWPRHHLYVCAQGNRALVRHLALRDWLRTHPEDAERYGALKHRLAVRFRNEREAYLEAKTGLVETILTRALGIGFCTDRTVLRPFWVDDAPEVYPVFADPEVMRFTSGEPDASTADTTARLERYVALQSQHGFSKWAVFDRESGKYLGDSGLTVVPETGEVELGYRLGRANWGRGLATELARAWLVRAFSEHGLRRVIAFADPENPASIRVMEKLKMTFARRDHLFGMDCVVYETTKA